MWRKVARILVHLLMPLQCRIHSLLSLPNPIVQSTVLCWNYPLTSQCVIFFCIIIHLLRHHSEDFCTHKLYWPTIFVLWAVIFHIKVTSSQNELSAFLFCQCSTTVVGILKLFFYMLVDLIGKNSLVLKFLMWGNVFNCSSNFFCRYVTIKTFPSVFF